MTHKRKAFTLAELLVVVIVLAALSAVAVPKFTRVLETRKTTEAEQLLAAVRTEQEQRCIIGKKYLINQADLPVLAEAPFVGHDMGLKLLTVFLFIFHSPFDKPV